MIGQRLREYRKTKGLTMKELGAVMGFSQGGISEIENGKTMPSTETLLKLVQNTDINLAWLLTGKGPMTWVDHPMVAMYEEKSLQVAEPSGIYGEGNSLDEVDEKIFLLLKDMPVEDRREILKSMEKEKLLRELLEERKRLKETG